MKRKIRHGFKPILREKIRFVAAARESSMASDEVLKISTKRRGAEGAEESAEFGSSEIRGEWEIPMDP